MHHIYHTQGFILSSKNIGEANKVLTVYTREMGLVRAMVQGVRLHKSKLRFVLQDLFYAKIDFVKGRDMWRITSAIPINSFPYARKNRGSLILISRISKLLERLCGQEETNEKIFDDFIQVLLLLDDENISIESREALELHLVLRIMNTLGYIGDSDKIRSYLQIDLNGNKIKNLLTERQSIIAYINKAINESQL